MDHQAFAQLLGNYGEFLGSIAVVITLAYLALQVRHARQATVDQNKLSRAQAMREQMIACIQDGQLRMNLIDAFGVADYYTALAADRGCTVEQASQVDWSNAYWFWVYWSQWATTHDEKSLDEVQHVLRNFCSYPTMRRSWEHSPWTKPVLEPEFVRFVEAVLPDFAEDVRREA